MVTSSASKRPPMIRSLSIDSHKPMTRSLHRCTSGLSHGLQMDLKQAVQLEKQELKKMGLVPPSIKVDTPLPKIVAPEDEEEQNYPYWLYRQQQLVRRAASFTSGQCSGCPPMPCSPPVPIPQHHEAQRRYSAAGGLGERMAHGVDAEQFQHMSESQCEARLWDEFWNYKLSFESRESFEASHICVKEDTTRDQMNLLKYGSESSMTDTVIEDEDLDGSVGPEEDEHVEDMFEMDDL